MADHWFERYRHAYRKWWETSAAELDEEEQEDFEEYASPDALTPVKPAALKKVVGAFPHLQVELRAFLSQVGAGDFHFPDHHGDHDPLVYRVFDLEEIQTRVASIKEHAQRELENLAEASECEVHGDDHDKCAAVLSAVRDNPWRFYPLFGPDDAHDFVYVRQGEPGDGVVARWYHDYPVCELLDGSNDTPNLSTYGDKLIAMAESDNESPM